VGVQTGLEEVLGLGADDLVHDLAVAVEIEGREARDVVTAGDLGMVVAVELGEPAPVDGDGLVVLPVPVRPAPRPRR